MSIGEASNKEYHDQNLLAETRAKRLRNAIGGITLSFDGIIVALGAFDKLAIPQNFTTSVLAGSVAGLALASVFRQHTVAQDRHVSALQFAAYEVSESNREDTDAPTWALEALNASGKSFDEILGPRSDQ